MADFESTANEAVSTLQAIDAMANSNGQELSSSLQQVVSKSAEYRQLNEGVQSRLQKLDDRAFTARNKISVRVDELKTKLSKLEEEATKKRDQIVKEIAEKENDLNKIDSDIQSIRSNAGAATYNSVIAVEAVGETLDDANEKLESALVAIESKLDAGSEELQGVIDSLNQEGDLMASMVEERLAAPMKEYLHAASTELTNLFEQWKTSVHEQTDVFVGNLGAAVTEMRSAQNDTWKEYDGAVAEAKETYDKQVVLSAGDDLLKSVTDLNDHMKQCEKAYEQVEKSLENTEQVLDKMAK